MFHFNYPVVPSHRKKEAFCNSKLERKKKERKLKTRREGKAIFVILKILTDILGLLQRYACMSTSLTCLSLPKKINFLIK